MVHTIIKVMPMGKRAEKPKKSRFTITFVPVEGDPVKAIANALDANVRSVLIKHGASLKMGLSDILRNHAKGVTCNAEQKDASK